MSITRNLRRIGMAAHAERMELRRDLEEKYRQGQEMRWRNQQKFIALLDEFKELDPAGWEEWYDNCKEIPEFISWDNPEPVLEVLQRQIDQIREGDALLKEWLDGVNVADRRPL